MAYGTQQARPDAIEGFRATFGREPNPGELRFMLAIARHESGYGEGWAKVQPGCAGSYNLGAIHAGQLAPDENGECPPGTCAGFDTNAAGERYEQCFKSYDTRAEAWADFARVLYRGGSGKYDREPVRAAAARGDLAGAVKAMKRSVYFGAPLDKYLAAVRRNDREIATILGEQPMSGGGGARGGVGLLLVAALGVGGLALAVGAR